MGASATCKRFVFCRRLIHAGLRASAPLLVLNKATLLSSSESHLSWGTPTQCIIAFHRLAELRVSDGLSGSWRIHSECPEIECPSLPIPAGSPDHAMQRNFELRTLRVVTLCSLPADDSFAKARRVAIYALRRHWLPSSGRTLLAALFEASSPIHEDRNGLPQPIERMEVSRLPPSYRHAGV